MNALRLRHIRIQLTLWNILVFGGIFAVYAFGTSWFFLSALNKQLDESLKEELELVDQLLVHSSEGVYPYDIHGESIHRLERFIEIWSTDRRLLYRSKTLGGRALGGAPDTTDLGTKIRTFSHLLSDGTRFRVAEKLHGAGNTLTVIRLSISEPGFFSYIHNFVLILLIGIPLGLLLVTISAYLMAHRALKPIDVMASTARRISADDLTERIPVKNPNDELGRLAFAFNELLARVQKSFEQLKRFTSDASHELRTPLTAMRSVGEVGLQVGRPATEYREVIGSMLEESSRLTKLVDSLLVLSRADSGKHMLSLEKFDLLNFVSETCALISILAEEKSQILNVGGQHGIIVRADRALLCQALLNLVDNAIKFSPEGGKITVVVDLKEKKQGSIEVRDSGPGISAPELQHIFERFYRLDKTNGSGSGLGLAIARWAVEANGGTIRVESQIDTGSTFHITIPNIATEP